MGIINTESNLVYTTDAGHLYFCRVSGLACFITAQEACILFSVVIRITDIVLETSSIIQISNIRFIIFNMYMCGAGFIML